MENSIPHLRRLCLLIVASLLFMSQSFAQAQAGWWWNPVEPGRGYFLEQQGNVIFLAGYLYADNGRASWVASTLEATAADDFSGPLLIFSRGQTLTGPWQPNLAEAPIGQVRLQFSDPQRALLTWPGGGVRIERAAFVEGGLTTANPVGTPQTGWWWNTAEPGRGFSIEIQNGVMFLGGFMYESAGRPIWYLSGQTPMTSLQRYRGLWSLYGNGQTLIGPYKPANLVDANVGAVSIDFSSATAGRLTLPDGRQIEISRFQFNTREP